MFFTPSPGMQLCYARAYTYECIPLLLVELQRFVVDSQAIWITGFESFHALLMNTWAKSHSKCGYDAAMDRMRKANEEGWLSGVNNLPNS